jgi:hypothetical protein
LLKTERITQGTTLHVEQRTARAIGSLEAAAWCTAGGSGPDTAAGQLQLPLGSYVLALSTTTYDTNGVALAHEIELHPPDTPIILDAIRL